MHKKLICLFLAVISVMSLYSCSGEKKENSNSEDEVYTAPAGYIGEGLRTMFDVLLTANVNLVNDVLKYGSPEYDTSKKKTENDEVYYLITEEHYTTYNLLREQIECVFSKDNVDSILNEYNQYKEFDGKLYVRKSYVEGLDGKSKMSTDTHNFTVEEKTDELCVASCKVKCGDKKKREFEVRFIKQDSEWRIENIIVG